MMNRVMDRTMMDNMVVVCRMMNRVMHRVMRRRSVGLRSHRHSCNS